MNHPSFLTFTGIDAQTNLMQARELSLTYPIEWGVLFSEERQGKENRYPSMEAIEYMLSEDAMNFSAHLCGRYAKAAMAGEDLDLNLSRFQRTQINHISPDQGKALAFAAPRKLTPIIQVRDLEFPDDEGCAMLFDRSGGRGTLATEWPRHPGDRMVGYAGGISPETINDVLAAVDSSGPYWLDMETGLRTDDLFDLDKCEAVAKAVYG